MALGEQQQALLLRLACVDLGFDNMGSTEKIINAMKNKKLPINESLQIVLDDLQKQKRDCPEDHIVMLTIIIS